MIPPRVHVEPDPAATARVAARFVAECARRAVDERGAFLGAFSGGSSPRAMLGALVAEDLPWRDLHLFQVDERTAPHGHADRNLTQLQGTLLGATPLASDQLHAMPVDDDDLEAAADRYGRELASLAGAPAVLDLVHLGLGDDGHTASLVPGDPALDVVDRDVTVTGAYRGYRRMTLTFPILNRARQRLWLASGAGKAEMLARLCAGDHGIPAGRVSAENAVIFTDQAAASRATT